MTSSNPTEGMFSFDTPQAVMHVLASVRKSEVPAQEKNNLRDLILSYTNGGKDPSLKIQIEQQLSRLAIQPQPTQQVSSATSADLDFGSSRNAPAFSAPAVSVTPQLPVTQPAVTPTPVPPPVVPAQPSSPTPTPAAPATPVVPQAPVAVTSIPAETIAAPVSPPPPPPPPTNPTPAAAVPTPVVPAADNSAALARVREIKSLVNEKIGNPVNLVDIDNQVGREYMSALLDAMKKLSSGMNSGSTMNRLEAAYAEVERVLKQSSETTQEPQSQVVPTKPVPVSQAPAEDVTADSASIPPTPPKPASAPPSPAEPLQSPVADKEPVAKPVEPEVSKPEVVAEQTESTPVVHDDRWAAASEIAKPVPAPIKPLSESAEPLKSVEDVPTQDSITNKNDDPLQTQEVTSGLNQLLSDWVLFKKSGLFGTGPKGVEHPLYKNIMQLQIPLLLAGRFEGATPEIKQSITDYMNGWRYEQGIVYEQGETFDHYLRRVIRHILDLQK